MKATCLNSMSLIAVSTTSALGLLASIIVQQSRTEKTKSKAWLPFIMLGARASVSEMANKETTRTMDILTMLPKWALLHFTSLALYKNLRPKELNKQI